MFKGFSVVDTKTGEYPDLWEIALKEDWAKHLMYCDMEGFAIEEDGCLILMDECGNHAYCPEGRFQVVFEQPPAEALTREQLQKRFSEPIWLSAVGCDGTILEVYDIVTGFSDFSLKTLRGESLSWANYGKTWSAYERRPEGAEE